MRIAPQNSDPAPILEIFNSNFSNKLLAAAVSHFNIFDCFHDGPLTLEELQQQLCLARRPAIVLVAGLLGLNLLQRDEEGHISPTCLAALHLRPSSEFSIVDYIHLASDARGVLDLVESLRNDRPASAQYIKTKGVDSIMDVPREAERLTECLAGRAVNCAPVLAEVSPLGDASLILDVGGGTGLFAIAYLLKHEHLRAIVLDLPNVLSVARKYAEKYGVSDRLECLSADMFRDSFPAGIDAILLSNVLHDWGETKCRQLLSKCFNSLPLGGKLLIHDAMLNDNLDGPLHIAVYSVVLFYLTEGRAYSELEYATWLRSLNFVVEKAIPTRAHCSVIRATKMQE